MVDAFWNGETTNFQLEKRWPDSSDPGVRAVGDWLWTLYDDFTEHRVSSVNRFHPAMNHRVQMCVQFLRSNEPYEWPHGVFAPTPQPAWLVYATFGLVGLWNKRVLRGQERYWREMKDHGDLDAWPLRRLPADEAIVPARA